MSQLFAFSLFLLLPLSMVNTTISPKKSTSTSFSLFLLLRYYHEKEKVPYSPMIWSLSVFSYCFRDKRKSKSFWYRTGRRLSVFSYCFIMTIPLPIIPLPRLYLVFQSFLIASLLFYPNLSRTIVSRSL